MKLAFHCLAAIVAASVASACAVPTGDPDEGAAGDPQEDRVQVDPQPSSREPGLQPQYLLPNTPCTDAEWQVAYDDNWDKRGPTTMVTSCSYNPNTGYVVYTYKCTPGSPGCWS